MLHPPPCIWKLSGSFQLLWRVYTTFLPTRIWMMGLLLTFSLAKHPSKLWTSSFLNHFLVIKYNVEILSDISHINHIIVLCSCLVPPSLSSVPPSSFPPFPFLLTIVVSLLSYDIYAVSLIIRYVIYIQSPYQTHIQVCLDLDVTYERKTHNTCPFGFGLFWFHTMMSSSMYFFFHMT